MEKKLYCAQGYGDSNKLELREVKLDKVTSTRYTFKTNQGRFSFVWADDLNKNIEGEYGGFFTMFSESREFLIEQLRKYVSNEIKKSNNRISDLQSSFENVLSEN